MSVGQSRQKAVPQHRTADVSVERLMCLPLRHRFHRAMRLLCADDEEDIRTILQLALSLDPELEIELVESGEAALARARVEKFDAILLDGMMPGLDGYETCRRLKADPSTATVPVVFLTAKTQRTEVERALTIGAVACLMKPFDPMTLAAELRAALGQ
jgi:CheY-like chemotaxis protein